MENYTLINHADIFESLETFNEILGPHLTEDNLLEACKVSLPNWHPFSNRGIFSIFKAKEDENPRLEVIVAVNPKMSLEEASANNWVYRLLISEDFEKIKGFFVDNTLFSGRNGQFHIVNGPKKLTWTYEEPICESCQEKESAQTNDG